LATAVYLLCLLASVMCAALLIRASIKTRASLLFWSAACFSLFAVNNLLVVIDLLVLPTQVDLSLYRQLSNLAAVSTLLYGFIQQVD
jgi:hypothetical protein